MPVADHFSSEGLTCQKRDAVPRRVEIPRRTHWATTYVPLPVDPRTKSTNHSRPDSKPRGLVSRTPPNAPTGATHVLGHGERPTATRETVPANFHQVHGTPATHGCFERRVDGRAGYSTESAGLDRCCDGGQGAGRWASTVRLARR